MSTFRRTLAIAILTAGAVGLSASDAAAQLHQSSLMTGTWTSGPRKVVFARDIDKVLWMFDESVSNSSDYYWTRLTDSSEYNFLSDRAVTASISTPTGWEMHVFFPKGGGAARTIGHSYRRFSQGGSAYGNGASLPSLPSGVTIASLGVTSNVYRRGDYLEVIGTTPKMSVYLLDGNGSLWEASYNNGQWSNDWVGCGAPPYGGLGGGNPREIEVSNDFDTNGNLLTSVWAVQDQHRLVENHGPFAGDATTRTWTAYSDNADSLDYFVKPVAITWYDWTSARTSANAHTRVMVPVGFGSDVVAFYRGGFGTTMSKELLGQTIGSSLSGGAYLETVNGCYNCFPTQKSLVVAFDNNAMTYKYLGKDNTHVTPPLPWTAVPPPTGGATSSSPFTRIDMGMGSNTRSSPGTVFVINNVGHLVELDPVTNSWKDKGYPGVFRAKPVSVSQSQTYSTYGPELAIDGNIDGEFWHGSVTHTENLDQPFWQADLGASKYVHTIDIYNRTDCCGDRLSNFNVLLSDDGVQWTLSSNTPGQAGSPTSLSVKAYGRYVRVQLVGTNALSLAEVVIWLTGY